MKKAGLKQKVLCSVLAASVFGVMYAGNAYAASVNGVEFKDTDGKGITFTDKVLVEQAGSKKFIMGQGDKIVVATEGSVGGLLYDLKDAGKDFDKIRAAIAKNSVVGVVGGEGMMDQKLLVGLNIIRGSNGVFDKIANIHTTSDNKNLVDYKSNVRYDVGTNVVIGGLDKDGKETSPVVIGAVGGDLSLNTKLNILLADQEFGGEFDSTETFINRKGDVNLTVNSGNVLGALGGSAAITVGNAKVDALGFIKADMNGKTTTTIDGNINTFVNEGANVVGLMNGGAAVAIGGESKSEVTGSSHLVINSAVNSSELEGIAVGAAGGGLSVSTLGGKADSSVGDVKVEADNGLVLGLAGGGAAVSIDATLIGGKLMKHEVGGADGKVTIDEKQLEDLLGIASGIPKGTLITIDNAIQGGNATAVTGNTNINLTGSTTALGVVGGGVAGSVHTFNIHQGNDVPDGMNVGDVLGSSVSNAKTGKTTINVNVGKADGSKLSVEEKGALISAIAKIPALLDKNAEVDSIVTGLQDVVKGMADKGAVIGVTGGGLAVSYTDLNQGKVGENVGAKATVENAGADLNLNSGYVVGAFGGGVAVANRESKAEAKTTDKITINVDGAEVIGLFANGGAAHREAAKEGGIANVTATDTEVNINAGSVDGLFGGGLAVRSGAYDQDTAKVVTSGTSAINIKGNVNKLAYENMGGVFDKIGFGEHFKEVAGLAKDAAVVAGGVAAGTGSYAEVNKSVINIEQGADIKNDVVAGGVAAQGGTSLVKDSVINLNGGNVDGMLYGQGLGTGATVEKSTLNVKGNNTLAALADGGSKIVGFTEANFAADSVTTITGLKAGNDKAFIDANGGKIIVNEGAKLDISKLDKDKDNKYFIAGNYADTSRLWNDDELAYDRTEGFATVVEDKNNKDYKVTYKELDKLNEEEQKDAVDSMENALGEYGDKARGILEGLVKDGKNTNEGAKDLIADLTKDTGDVSADLRSGLLFGEAAGVTSNSISMATDFADNAALRLSFTQDKVNGENKVAEEGGVWAKYLHNKHEVDGVSSSLGGLTSSNDYSGVMVGAELAKKGDYQYGIAFAYGDGDGSGMGVENDFDSWGVNLYSNLKKDDVNYIADLGYSKTSNELTGKVAQGTMTADRDVNILTAGIRAEKLYVNGNTQVVPYVGLRYFNIDGDSYTTNYNGKVAFQNEADSQNVWTLPVGVSLRNETVTESGWRFTPKVDLAYIFAFGDTDSSVTVNSGSGMSTLSYDVMDSSSWLASAALEAGNGDWSYGVGYSYQKGSDVENNKWFVNVNYSF